MTIGIDNSALVKNCTGSVSLACELWRKRRRLRMATHSGWRRSSSCRMRTGHDGDKLSVNCSEGLPASAQVVPAHQDRFTLRRVLLAVGSHSLVDVCLTKVISCEIEERERMLFLLQVLTPCLSSERKDRQAEVHQCARIFLPVNWGPFDSGGSSFRSHSHQRVAVQQPTAPCMGRN